MSVMRLGLIGCDHCAREGKREPAVGNRCPADGRAHRHGGIHSRERRIIFLCQRHYNELVTMLGDTVAPPIPERPLHAQVLIDEGALVMEQLDRAQPAEIARGGIGVIDDFLTNESFLEVAGWRWDRDLKRLVPMKEEG